MGERASSSGNRTPAASSRRSHQSDLNVITPVSSLSLKPVKSVLLHDWWLVKNQSRQISVAGLAYEGKLGARSFSSAPIFRRIDTTTLETIDGIIITISGFINRSQMHQNGFPFWVCNDFELGFPYKWKECIAQCNNEESAKRCVSTEKPSNSSFSSGTKENSFLPLSSDNLSAARIRDLVLNMTECSEKSVCDHIMGKVANNVFENSQDSTKFEADEMMRNRKRAKADLMNNNDDDDVILDAEDMAQTRSRHSSKNLGSKEENLRLKSSEKSKNLRNKPVKVISGDSSAQLSTPTADKNISPQVVCSLKASDISSVRRSGRLKIQNQKSFQGMTD